MIYTYMEMCVYTHIHTHIYTYTHTYIHAYTHTYGNAIRNPTPLHASLKIKKQEKSLPGELHLQPRSKSGRNYNFKFLHLLDRKEQSCSGK